MKDGRDWYTGGRVIGIRHVQTGQLHLVGDRPLTLGRKAGHVDIVVDDEHVSGIHCAVQRTEGDAVLLEDLRSTNGTTVNRDKVTRCGLRDGDVIRIAGQSLVACADVKERRRLAGPFLGKDARFGAALAEARRALEQPPGVLLHDRSGGWTMGMLALRFAFSVLGPGCPWVEHRLRPGWIGVGGHWDAETIEWRAGGGVAIIPHLNRIPEYGRRAALEPVLPLAFAGKLRALIVAKTLPQGLGDLPVVRIPTLEERSDLGFLIDHHEKAIKMREHSELTIPPAVRRALLRLRSPDDPDSLRVTVELVHSVLREGSLEKAAVESAKPDLQSWLRVRNIPVEDLLPRSTRRRSVRRRTSPAMRTTKEAGA